MSRLLPPGAGKVLAATEARDGRWLLGTRDTLFIVDPRVVEPVETIPWERIATASWDRDAELLTVVEVGEYGQVRPSYTFETDDPGRLAQLVRERVTASVVLRRRVVVSGKRGLYVVARRPPHGPGEISFAFEFDPGVDPSDPDVTETAQAALQVAVEDLGR